MARQRERSRGRAFDPLRRAKDFPRMPSPRKEILSIDRRLQRVDNLVDLALSLALRQPGASPVEVLNALPEPTPLDLGRQIVVRLPGETVASIYMGLVDADNVVFWQRLAQGTAGGGGTSPEFTFVGVTISGLAFTGVWLSTSYVWCVAVDGNNVYRVNRSTGVWVATYGNTGAASGIVLDGAANVYLSQPGLGRVMKIVAADVQNPVFTSVGHVYNSVAHKPGTANLYATATDTNAFYKLNMATLAITNTVTGLSTPQGIAIDSGDNVYVTNAGTHKVRKYNSSLVFQSEWGVSGSGDGQLNTPRGIAIDGSDRVYISDSNNDRVQVFDVNGTFLGKLGSSGSGSGQLDAPNGVAVSGSGIVVADVANNRVVEWLRA